MRKPPILYLLMVVFIVLASCRKSERFNNKTFDKVTALVSSGIKDRVSGIEENGSDRRNDLDAEIQQFYRERGFRPAWLTVDEPLPMAGGLEEAIRKSPEEGLSAEDYQPGAIRELQRQVYADTVPERVAKAMASLDVMMTTAYMQLASHLSRGKINPEKADSNWQAYPRKQDLSAHLARSLKQKQIAASLFTLVPDSREYRDLRDALAFYRAMAAQGGWHKLSPDPGLQKGDSSKAVKAVKQRLVMSGDLKEVDLRGPGGMVYDEPLVLAIRQFQKRHGIEGKGELTPETLAAMNVPVGERIAQIALNMQRLRWLPDSLGADYLMVNIPDYSLKVYQDHKKILEMRVIVGKAMHATPVFSDTMEYIVFNPTWTVPLSIARKEFLPKLKDDAEEFLEEGNYLLYESWAKDARQVDDVKDIDWKDMEEEEFNFKLVEKPGQTNSLGRIKFMLPNNKAIYLHDTPAGHLFDNSERDFSHGCIRVEKPLVLAKYLLKGKEWEDEKIRELLEREEPQNITLPEKLPVHIVYQSAWVDENGLLNFRKDIYQHDKTQKMATKKKEASL